MKKMKFAVMLLSIAFTTLSCQKSEETVVSDTVTQTETSENEVNSEEANQDVATMDPNYFQGTKRFCEFLNAWEYEVTITGADVKISKFPGSDNEFYPDKTKPTEVHTGKIVNGVLTVNRPENCENCGPEYETSMFKYADGVFSVANGNDYTDYQECK